MGANMLDTYTLVKRLTQAGVPEAQAEAHMSVFLDMSERGFATKGDIAALGKRIDDLATHVAGMDVRLAGMDLRLSGMELRLMVRLGGLIVTLMSVGFGVLEFTLAH
ncbi:hypothetical protein C4901_15190 [Acidiferrobacter sp. SPIII_3]|uniref:hypothetical protein n=1 Tax=Acidiferrobacter sp. SPIII_3 TaxID=1281578 RepID=UPI000D72BE8B|nr:hypothetical protein [Acidiferrobacter sp. SPIII_3]AWP24502.1 hypothetical protein C4901_15190 [Acidiferrobacter sp. SPIII_3]